MLSVLLLEDSMKPAFNSLEQNSLGDILSSQELSLAAIPANLLSTKPMPLRSRPEFELLVACCGFARQAELSALLMQFLDWDYVLDAAERHRLIPALDKALASKTSMAKWRPLRACALTHAWRSLNLIAELKRIASQFERFGIPSLAYKGPALGRLLYGDPAMRQFGDLDFLVKTDDVARAGLALQELGYTPKLRLPSRQETSHLRSGYEHTFSLNSERPLVEVQWQIVPRFYAIDFDIEAIFQRSAEIDLGGYKLRTLGYDDSMLVLCVHAAKHEWSQLGMLRDITTLAQFDLNWKWIVGEARRLGILKILQASLLAGKHLFGISLPGLILSQGVAPDAFQLATRIIKKLEDGCEPNTESLSYFRNQLQVRERWQDKARFVSRLVITPSVAEWSTVQLPSPLFSLYRGIRVARLLKKIVRSH